MILAPFSLLAQQEEFTLTGVYNGKDLFVQNPLSGNMKDYCTKEVWVNGEQVLLNPRSSAFTIKLTSFTSNSPLEIKIIHLKGCTPKVINPQVIRTKTNFRFVSMHLNENNLEWVTTGESRSGKFFLEKWDGSKWRTLESLNAKGQAESRYQLPMSHEAETNRYRVKYLQGDGESFYSSVQEFEEKIPPITFVPTRVSDKIYLSREAEYIVSDPKGNQLLKGHGKEINLGHLTTGLYYLNIDNRKEKFFKK